MALSFGFELIHMLAESNVALVATTLVNVSLLISKYLPEFVGGVFPLDVTQQSSALRCNPKAVL